MAADPVRLLLDAGGQGCRALAADAQGARLAEAYREVPTRLHGLAAEQDGEAVVRAVQGVAGEVCRALARNGEHIHEAALAVQRGSIVCWHRRTGEALSPVLSWRDRRGQTRFDQDPAIAIDIRRRTGLRFSPYGGGPKFAWCLNNLPGVAAAADAGELACGALGAFLVFRLVKDRPCTVDDTLAQRTLLWSRDMLDWDPRLLRLFGLSRDLLPTVVPSMHRFGRLADLKDNPPLVLLTGDQNAVPFLAGSPDPQTLFINMGTGAFLVRPLREPIDPGNFQLSLLDRAANGCHALEGSVHGGASALRWLEQSEGGRIAESRFEGLRERVPAPPLFLNRVDGLGSPWWTGGPAPGFVSAPGATGGPDARLLGVLESIAFLIRVNHDGMSRITGAPGRVLLTGGLSRNPALCTLLADILDTPVFRLEAAEGSALGMWCRLSGQSLADRGRPVPRTRRQRSLEERFHHWLAHMPESRPAK